MRQTLDRPSPTVEDYLQEIYNLLEDGKSVIAARLAERIGVSLPTAWATLQRMQRDDLVEPQDRPEIHPTQQARQAAESVTRPHFPAAPLLADPHALARLIAETSASGNRCRASAPGVATARP